ncbi:DsbA family protein [Mycobacterium sp. CBMA293]|uniref:DsbA family protein n=1 Tax=unclassified Mycolicibacterium TaxID=2636767 RepID=UPI0013210F61|nr:MULTISPECIES: DsbA family protein [unclassified Mycolicibacterium]MUL45076.1 DsbA family protein [Mycolicibacterium sp. CBMA 360]MUL97373.1 DsbA family protein [Mycolicibacterium sp. CBMA 230]MUM33000.1 DsbA family protein [Mycolicibacterium sp. CBMA 361]MUL57811.1 DsbA family protein [Mycolicibacterium sp. CBMA 335]MUL72740.1 DsbA family protein [Mycolicibacterium sp. CBMA 311]
MPSKSSKSSKNPSYDLKAADRKRDWVVKGGLTALVIVFAVALVAYIVMNGKPKADPHQVKAVQLAASNVVTKPGTKDPKVTLTIYEDFLCPICGVFEKTYGPTIAKLVDNGDIAVEYNIVSIIGRGDVKSYSTRAGAMAYCVADENKDAFRRFHGALYANQPEETATSFPDNAKLLEYARQSGVPVGPNDPLTKCVDNSVYSEMVNNMARNAQIQGTPTIKINGADTSLVPNGDPNSLIEKIKAIAPDLPNLTAVPAAPAPGAPAPGAPAPQPAPAPHP